MTTLEEKREEIFGGEDRSLYMHLGYFLAWFSAVELRITILLAIATGAPDYQAFDLLVKGMDARVKLHRLRQAAKRYKPIGPNLKERLDFFEKEPIKVRNILAHNSFYTEHQESVFHFISLTKIAERSAGLPFRTGPDESIRSIDLFTLGLWLNYFSEDLGDVHGAEVSLGRVQTKTLEIEKPRTGLPTKPPSHHPETHATSDTHAQTPPQSQESVK